tara:strand:- start:239 stop:577 length:339 start_codon:yes stop_codon:yes gene_type:complete
MGCANQPKLIEVSAKPIDKPELVLPMAQELNLRDVDWVVVTADNVEQVLADIKKTGRPVVLFALTDKGYENISLNLSDLRSYIQQQQAIMAAYNRYYKDAEDTIDEYNQTVN